MDLNKISTYELVGELMKRTEIETIIIDPYNTINLTIEGAAIIMIDKN